ncbi:MAG: EF-hand domain-containing protein [Myxococcales bacterium]|nr:EF-hand domain-containing protein [Myxococcales bacterium]
MEKRLSEDQLASIHDEFARLDTDGDGAITRTELRTAMEAAGYLPTDAELERELARADFDADGRITLREWVHMWTAAILADDAAAQTQDQDPTQGA